MARQEPEEIASRIVWGIENQFVSETTGFLVDRLTSVNFHDYDAEYWVRRMANENPVLLNDIYLKYKDRITAEAAEILEPYLRDLDTEKALQDFSGHTELSAPYSAATERLTNATVKGCTEIIARQNVAMIEQQAQAWYEIASTAVTRQNATMLSERQIIADAVKELSARQIFTVDYKSGVHNKIDVAIRRHIVTQCNQNYQRMNELRANEYDWDLFSCSAHPASRPEHFPLQGCIFSKGRYIGQKIDGETVRDYDEMDIGSVTGIYGANCSHYTTVYIPGLSQLQEPPYDEEENEKRYELTQTQRYYERQIRATKTEIADLQRAGQDATQERLKLGQQQARLREFCDTNKLTRDKSREYAYGIGEQPRALRGSTAKATTASATAKQTAAPKVQAFEPFETMDEAREYLSGFVDTNAYGAKFDISKLSLESANGLSKALHDVSVSYGFELRSIQPMNFRTNQFKGSTADAAYQWFLHDLHYNPNYYKNTKALESHIKEALELQESVMPDIQRHLDKGTFAGARERYARAMLQSGRSNVSTDYADRWAETTFIHELGHALDDQKFRKLFKQGGFDVGESMSQYASGISAYATTSNQEYVAESFLSYMLGETERVDPALAGIFEKAKNNG